MYASGAAVGRLRTGVAVRARRRVEIRLDWKCILALASRRRNVKIVDGYDEMKVSRLECCAEEICCSLGEKFKYTGIVWDSYRKCLKYKTEVDFNHLLSFVVLNAPTSLFGTISSLGQKLTILL